MFVKLFQNQCEKYGGRLPKFDDQRDVDAIGLLMESFSEYKIWTSIVDGDIGKQNGNGNYEDFYNRGKPQGQSTITEPKLRI